MEYGCGSFLPALVADDPGGSLPMNLLKGEMGRCECCCCCCCCFWCLEGDAARGLLNGDSDRDREEIEEELAEGSELWISWLFFR